MGKQIPATDHSLLDRITIDPDVRCGKPCIRGHRITVQEILEGLSGGASQAQILADYPQLEPDDFLAVYAYAAELAAGGKVAARHWLNKGGGETESDKEQLRIRKAASKCIGVLARGDAPTRGPHH